MKKGRGLKNFSTMTDSQLLEKGLTVVKNVKANSAYPTVQAKTQVLDDATARYSNGLVEAKSRDKVKVKTKNVLRDQLEAALADLLDDINYLAKGNVQMILAAGYDINQTKASKEVGEVKNFNVKHGKNSGEVIASVPEVIGATSFQVDFALVPAPGTDENWQSVSGRYRKYTIPGLVPGKEYVFRVAAKGTRNQTVYSKKVSIIVV